MAKKCPNCGDLLLNNELFCTRCGTPLSDVAETTDAVNLSKPAMNPQQPDQSIQQSQPINNSFQQPDYSQQMNYRTTPDASYANYSAPVPNSINADMTVKDWILTLLVLIIPVPLVSIIIYLIWGFSETTNVNKRNFCKAYLLFMLIAFGIAIVFMLIFGVGIAAAIGSIASSYR